MPRKPADRPNTTDTELILKAINSLGRELSGIKRENERRHIENTKRFDTIAADFIEVKKAQDYTNGNVRNLLLWQSNMQAVEEYKKQQEAEQASNPKDLSTVKGILWAIGIIIAAVVAFLGTVR